MRAYGVGDYAYPSAAPAQSNAYLLPAVDEILADWKPGTVFDLGCGNGSVSAHLSRSYQVVGIDASESGIAQARMSYPGLRVDQRSVYDDLARAYGVFDAVVSLEVVEHLYDPRTFARRLFDLTKPGGGAILSTPYHSYFKNLALAVSGKMDAHFTALWDGGHIKFWSVKTLGALLEEAGFRNLEFRRVGRIPALAKSMICLAHRPAAS